MPQAQFQSIGIEAVVTAVPKQVERLEDLAELYQKDPGQMDRMRKVMQLEERRIAPPGMTSLDLCEHAARTLIKESELNPIEIDAVICVTQTPDYLQPSNANVLHGRLGLGKHVAAFDVNQGCSGWVYGLYLAACMLSAGGVLQSTATRRGYNRPLGASRGQSLSTAVRRCRQCNAGS